MAKKSGQIQSPIGRYLQVRVRLAGGQDTLLRHLAVYYLAQNRPTRITSVKVEPEDSARLSTLKNGGAGPRSPVVKLSWKVNNPDSDKTQYKLAVRREGDVLWRPITSDRKRITSTSHKWNTETYSDGYYRLRVTADDRNENAPGRALQNEHITPLFLVDNSRPTVDAVRINYPRVSARAVDGMSSIAEMAYSVDNGPWQLGASVDGLFDEEAEMVTVTLPPALTPGTHTITIRVADEAGNIGSKTATFRVR